MNKEFVCSTSKPMSIEDKLVVLNYNGYYSGKFLSATPKIIFNILYTISR